jgi:hypothetical protein
MRHNTDKKQPISGSGEWEKYKKYEKGEKLAPVIIWIIAIVSPPLMLAANILDNTRKGEPILTGVIENVLVIMLGLVLPGVVMTLTFSSDVKKQRRRFEELFRLIVDEQLTSATEIANAANRPLDDIIVDIKEMIEREYFNAQFDAKTNTLIACEPQEKSPLNDSEKRTLTIIKRAQLGVGIFFATVSVIAAIYVAISLVPTWGMAANIIAIFVLLAFVFVIGVLFLIAGMRKLKR